MNSERMRVDKLFKESMKEAKIKRIKNGLEKDISKITDQEITRMFRNTPSFLKVFEELTTLPRKENLK